MVFLTRQDEWWLCQAQDCSKADRASPLETQVWLDLRLREVKTDLSEMSLRQELMRDNISIAPLHLRNDALMRRIEHLFAIGQLHLHRKRREVRWGIATEEQNVPFPLADRQPRGASQPPPMMDAPVFSPNTDMSAQAATLVAAAASGTPFCKE